MGVVGQRYAPAALPQGKTRYPLYRKLGGPQNRSGQVRKISPPPEFDPRIVQPVVSRCTDWAVPAHEIIIIIIINDYTSNNWSHWNSNEKLKEKFGNYTRKILDRFSTKDSYTWNITHNTESTAMWSLKPEWWDHRWFKRSTRKKCLWHETYISYNNNNNNNAWEQHSESVNKVSSPSNTTTNYRTTFVFGTLHFSTIRGHHQALYFTKCSTINKL